MLPADGRDGACVVVDGQPVRVSLKERYEQFPHVLTTEEQQRLRRWPDTYVRRFDQLPSGELTFVVENVSGGKANWSEGKRWKQEERIGAVLGGVEAAARSLRDQRLERERREREREAERLRRVEEQRRTADLERQIQAWRLARDIRAFVAEQRRAAEDAAPDGPDDELADWLDWALMHADRIDPVVGRWRPHPGGGSDDRDAPED